jgi:hypothetical protein
MKLLMGVSDVCNQMINYKRTAMMALLNSFLFYILLIGYLDYRNLF